MVDADAFIPGQGYLTAEGVDAPEICSAFAARAEELSSLNMSAPGDFSSGWLDSTACCRILADIAGLAEPRGWFDAAEVKEMFASAAWPDLETLKRDHQPGKSFEYSNHVIAKAFVDLCVTYGLGIEFS